ncbi:NAD(P)/FAD-dependent oxidoreductase (plasmid) [Rhodococcoides fascians A21d2]|uniref:flavin-containing monooxygenase n=1 Tax=Rhodococcoides fascians TaxID=1828 RepID=UPI0005699714|nr:NAD(P)/FAD-dependent oxidoreductase [Rhodococcus fascians]QII03650.1 NAD(P)/FAD-dependent oxidoreductase [Rhodococcus fascians A21d2]
MTTSAVEELDVLIIGAGISGIGAAYYLQRDHPDRSYAIVESREAPGGTWDQFRYPGIRSDSDLHTFGYEFKPWRDDAIASGDKILAYLQAAAAENGIDEKIRLRLRVVRASWSSAEARWSVDLERTDTAERIQIRARWLFCATGYYRYDYGYTPRFEGQDRFGGRILHPQEWPDTVDFAGKRVVVIGSGATAVTLLPALADGGAEHVTMLQRSPSYVLPVPSRDRLAEALVSLLGEQRGSALTRRKNITQQRLIYRFCRRFPRAARAAIRRLNMRHLPSGYPVDVHFSPSYDPWEQRMCVVPDGDLFRVISSGKASVATDRIETFTEDGIALSSGEQLDADIIVTATGLNLQFLGGIDLCVDGESVNVSERVVYRGMMLDGVPNMSFAIGYTTASWTLKVGILCEQFCGLLTHMRVHGYDSVIPHVDRAEMKTRPFLDFSAGYVQRAVAELPRQGDATPWLTSMDYLDDVKLLRAGSVADPHLRFGDSTRPAAPTRTANSA